MNYNSKYVVRLSDEERDELRGIVGRGKVAAAKRMRAQLLLRADAGAEGSGPTDEEVSDAFGVSTRAVQRGRKTYVEVGLPAALERQPARQDYEYERRSTANLFMLFAPLAAWRHVKVTAQRRVV